MKIYIWMMTLVILSMLIYSQTSDTTCACSDQLTRMEIQQITTSSDLKSYINNGINTTVTDFHQEVLDMKSYLINDSITRDSRLTDMIYRETSPYKFTIPMVLGIIFGSSLVLALSTRRR